MWWQDHLSEFVTLFLVINPFGSLPIFMALTASLNGPERRQVALTAISVALALLVFFVVGGNLLLRWIGISIRAFQIAGGIVLFLVALDMIQGRVSGSAGAREGSHQSLAIYPLAFPLIAGPGSFITVILLTEMTATIFWANPLR
jgi:multiple antibiotic resistance protein